MTELSGDDAYYIVNNYRRLMTAAETSADRAFLFEAKVRGAPASSPATMCAEKLEQALRDPEVMTLFQKGRDHFNQDVAPRIVTECRDSLGLCARCGGILRTIRAEQCLHCGYDWHRRAGEKS